MLRNDWLFGLIGASLWGLEAALGRFEPVVVRHRVPLGYFQTKQSSALGFQLAAGRIAEVGPERLIGACPQSRALVAVAFDAKAIAVVPDLVEPVGAGGGIWSPGFEDMPQ